ncbi:Rpn family recombination-promoting nuclease/putative transposase [uncultured Treponema sp.]|uniref:Rpn family recombination-promoting nuclease/putative transposase n=1 Tax=uncultured Treponema sp. TaxID=162155 RepID=UPI0025D9016E|nr:Rpn family recombination-promoting nuclease/putative transposase [uncultured Treponema sp.]
MQRHELTPAQKWERLTLADNFIFCKVLEDNPEVCRHLIEILLNIKIDRIEKPAAEKSLKTDFISRGIRFDVYVKDGNGRSFDIEIQTTRSTSLAKRARYYQGLMDVDNVQHGSGYDVLNESYVVFLCMGDAFGKGFPVYTFRYRADEDKDFLMDDGTVNVFFNAKKYDTMKSEELRAFFKYLCGKEPSSGFTDRLSALVERVKTNVQWRHRFMTWEQEMAIQSNEKAKEIAKELAKDMAKDIAQDMAKDMAKNMAQDMAKDIARNMVKDTAQSIVNDIANQKVIETAQKMLKEKIGTPEQISMVTSIPLEKVLELKKEIQ